MTELNIQFHDKQLEIYESEAKFIVAAGGRRSGKSYYAVWRCLLEGLRDYDHMGRSLEHKEIYYVAPTLPTAEKAVWSYFKTFAPELIKKVREKDLSIELINGRKITLKGADRPDGLRGVGLSFVVLDEYADMKTEVWEEILEPTLTDTDGDALFIGTPKGKNHFYHLWLMAGREEYDDWEQYQFKSEDNPYIDKRALERRKKNMSKLAWRQEMEASFETLGATTLDIEMVKRIKERGALGDVYITVDLCGFTDTRALIKDKKERLDDTVIAVVDVGPDGWYIMDMIYGRWDTRSTAARIIAAAKKYNPVGLGIEKGSLYNAALPYLDDMQRRMGWYKHITGLSHGGRKKTERITWALQSRLEAGRLMVPENAPWLGKLYDQMRDFPNPMVHDDLLDALAYMDQIAVTSYNHWGDEDLAEWEVIDELTGW